MLLEVFTPAVDRMLVSELPSCILLHPGLRYTIQSLPERLPLQVCFQFCPTHIASILLTYSHSLSAQHISPLYHISCCWRSAFQSATSARSSAYSSFRSISSVPIFLLINSTRAINNSGSGCSPVSGYVLLQSPNTADPHYNLLFVCSYVPSTSSCYCSYVM